MSISLARQPKPFYLIFLIEIWERFGFYGVQALLVLFMVQQLRFTDTHADFLYSAFGALAYLLPCVGGYIGDKLLGTKRTILLGAITLAIGYFLLSLQVFHTANLLIMPLAVIAVGNGLFKANPSSLLSKVYEGTCYNLDSGFTLYYMAINIGSFLSMNLTPILSKYFGWHIAFLVCFIGLALAVINFILMRRIVKPYGSAPDLKPLRLDYFAYVIAFILGLVVACYFLLHYYQMMSWLLIGGTVALLLIYFGIIGKAAKSHERNGMFLFSILFVQAIVFFVLYFQAPTSLTLFALRNVHHSVLGIPIQPGQFQMFNALWVLALGPMLAIIYQALAKRKRDFSMPSKFSLGMLLAGLAFLCLPLGSLFAHNGVVSGMWLVIYYGFQSVGELLVSALGLAVAARYVPQRFMGFSMGLWFLSISIANIIAGKVASIASVPKNISHDPVASLPIYNHLFLEMGIITVAIALLMFALVPVVKKLAETKKTVISNPLLVEDLANDHVNS
jgi:POT family proton-dependent oligopeptide transporter